MDRLTSRERQMVNLRCGEDLTMKQAADRMFIETQTVRNYTTATLRKLGMRSFNAVCALYGREAAERQNHDHPTATGLSADDEERIST